MGWKIVEIDTNDNLSLYLNNLMIKRQSKKIIININDIDILLLDNYKLTLSVQLINALTRNNSLIITFDGKHEPASFIYGVNGNHNSLKILQSQLMWTNFYKGKLWQEIIRNKINNQYHHLLKNSGEIVDSNYFLTAIEKVKSFDISNREGHIAKVYWHILFGIDFTRDYEAIKFPLLNSMLNYGYSILRAMVIKSIVKKGLDPRIAIFHKSFSNFYALASDLMEPFRIIIDQIVYRNKNSDFFSVEIKQALIEGLTKKIIFKGKEEYINNAIDKAIDEVIKGQGWIWVDTWR